MEFLKQANYAGYVIAKPSTYQIVESEKARVFFESFAFKTDSYLIEIKELVVEILVRVSIKFLANQKHFFTRFAVTKNDGNKNLNLSF